MPELSRHMSRPVSPDGRCGASLPLTACARSGPVARSGSSELRGRARSVDVAYAVLGDFEVLVVRAVFLGLLGHQDSVGIKTHGLRINKVRATSEKLIIS